MRIRQKSDVLRQAMSAILTDSHQVINCDRIDKYEKLQKTFLGTEQNVHSSPRKVDFCQCFLK